jgi:hypothetical protein
MLRAQACMARAKKHFTQATLRARGCIHHILMLRRARKLVDGSKCEGRRPKNSEILKVSSTS